MYQCTIRAIALIFILIFIPNCNNKESLVDFNLIRSYQNNLRFDAATDLRFRFRSHKCSIEDLNKYFDLLFEAYLSDRNYYHELKKFSLNLDNYAVDFDQLIDLNDPFNLHRFGDLSIKRSTNYLAFYTKTADGSDIRLRIIPVFDTHQAGKSYQDLANDFRSDILKCLNIRKSVTDR